jgi:hypothetical protein
MKNTEGVRKDPFRNPGGWDEPGRGDAAISQYVSRRRDYVFRSEAPPFTEDRLHGEGEAVLAAGLITLVGLAGMQFIVWAIGLAFIFMVHQSLARIERRMAALEERGLPPQ